MTTNTTTLTPAAVSALLRRGGLNPLASGTPTTYEGIRVKRGAVKGTVTVVVDTDSPNITKRLADDALAIVRAAHLLVAVNPYAPHIFTVGRSAR